MPVKSHFAKKKAAKRPITQVDESNVQEPPAKVLVIDASFFLHQFVRKQNYTHP